MPEAPGSQSTLPHLAPRVLSFLSMTVATVRRRLWWQYLHIPDSWLLSENDRSDRPRDQRDRDRDRELDLEDTRSFRRRYEESAPPPSAPRIQVPLGVIVTVVLYLVGQLVGGVWWAATLQSNLQHEIMDRAKEEDRLWQSIQTYRLEIQQLRVENARGQDGRRQPTDQD